MEYSDSHLKPGSYSPQYNSSSPRKSVKSACIRVLNPTHSTLPWWTTLYTLHSQKIFQCLIKFREFEVKAAFFGVGGDHLLAVEDG